MKLERSATSISWIPSESLPLPLRYPFDKGLMHYDDPLPLTLTDLDEMRRRGAFRFANHLRAWVELDGDKIEAFGYSGGLIMGLTPITVGRLRVLLPTKRNPVIQHSPEVTGGDVTFVQTAGNRPGFSFVRPMLRWPFLATRPFTIWTTIELTISVDGSSRQRLIGASPFPRHWLYDNEGRLAEKAAITWPQLWLRTVFGTHTPWGGEDQEPVVAAPESDLERSLSEQVMHGAERPMIRTLKAGDFLFRQGETASGLAVVLDGTFEVRVGDAAVGTIGPGAVVGERAVLEHVDRTADVQATSAARVALVTGEDLNAEALAELALGHHRENGV